MKVALLPKWPAAIGLVVGTVLLTRSVPTTFAADRPVHSGIVTLAICGVVVLALSRVLSRDVSHEGAGKHTYEAVPLEEVRRSAEEADETRDPIRDAIPPSSGRWWRISALVLVIALCVRVEVLRRVVRNVQCSTRSVTPLIPLVLAVEEWWRVRRRRRHGHGRGRSVEVADDDEEASAYEACATHIRRLPVAGMVSAGMVSVGGMVALAATASPRSTVICAATLPYRVQVPHLQWVGVVLDVLVVWCVSHLVVVRSTTRSLASRAAAVGWSLFLSAAFLLVVGVVYYFAEPADRTWIRHVSHNYVASLLTLDVYLVWSLVCALALMVHVGVTTTALLTTTTSILTATTTSAGKHAHPFPPPHLGWGLAAVVMILLGFIIHAHLEPASKHTPPLFPRGLPLGLHLGLATILLTWTTLFFTTSTTVTYHPIDLLIYQAQVRHEIFLAQASTSKNLSHAVHVYQHRYRRHPPPGFDRWYEYATAKDSLIIDDFDNIHHHLLPFYALEPHVIRERTWELISNPWNDAAGLRIRNGKVSVMDNGIPGTHAWMLDGLVEMIGKFSEYLPDMDLAFNLNDECRVVVSHENIEPMKRVAEEQLIAFDQHTTPKHTQFSPDRKAGWRDLPPERNHNTPLHEKSWQRIFETHGAMGCPPSSPARTRRIWDTTSLCTTCTSPHSLGAFLSNWTLAGDVCHQPDLADLHGMYLSPAAFKATHELYPFFSQSKVSGFNDILYPSSWNYMKKVEYLPTDQHPDVPWEEKKKVLFWRGATSEGVSQGWGQWKGMVRQRFVDMFSPRHHNAKSAVDLGPVGEMIPPNTTDSNHRPIHNKLRYAPSPQLQDGRQTDVHIVDNIVRCGGRDCADQAEALGPLVPGVEFQEHWKHSFLLDLDGAGFSGRFLPFLQSGSLPFKAGLFREWWEGRIGEWVHFVPLDVRGQGVRATVGYFAQEGTSGKGERIAREGSEWAGRVVRGVDMEVYMFRLLLEWGRVVDDERGEMGWVG